MTVVFERALTKESGQTTGHLDVRVEHFPEVAEEMAAGKKD